MTWMVRTPIESEAFLLVTVQLDLRIHMPCRYAWVLGPIEDHDPAICTHSSYYVWILGLVSSFIYFARVVDLLYDIEFDVDIRGFLRRPSSITT